MIFPFCSFFIHLIAFFDLVRYLTKVFEKYNLEIMKYNYKRVKKAVKFENYELGGGRKMNVGISR